VYLFCNVFIFAVYLISRVFICAIIFLYM